ncbi:PREDICTED: ubiquitin thioesterase OTU1 [Nicrophorus vespilloides]|uniref:Ubiquitin thioesterase OTU n=1 Tax=Nicrophorus vespilloides TaxID=110193 RepID=A0ABM1M8E2_NICVS|nr:PREDICTED: ubiquitin thioesterase OTU1 [Nicrophorus vespilloides]
MTTYALKVKMKTGQQIVKTLTSESTIKELKTLLSKLSNIPQDRLNVLSGFPPRILDLNHESNHLCSSGIFSGDTLILEEKAVATVPVTPPPLKPRPTATIVSNEDTASYDCPGILMKHVVPADNSCLFTSIHFVLNGKVDDTGSVAPWMRTLIAETVSKDHEKYSEAILGKPNADYCKWIQDDNTWGGAIEISILSSYYGIEIAVVDTINAIINRFGEDQDYGTRVFLLFDGIHYDPLYLEPIDGGNMQTIFPTEDETIFREAEQLAVEAKSSRQYTDVNKFTLKCIVCDMKLSGQVQAQQHAKSTGHTSFGEI